MEHAELRAILDALTKPEPDAAWAGFLESFAPLVLRTIRLAERDEDRISGCFLFVCESLAKNGFRRLRSFRFDGGASFDTWLRVVVRRLAVDWHRKMAGRYRPFESIRRLSSLDIEIYRAVYERGLDSHGAFLSLRPRYPDLSLQSVRDGIGRIEGEMSSRHHYLLALRRAEHDPSASETDGLADGGLDPEVALIEKQQREALERATRDLSAGERYLLALRFEKGLTLDAMARLTGAPSPQNVDRRLRSIVARLRKALSP